MSVRVGIASAALLLAASGTACGDDGDRLDGAACDALGTEADPLGALGSGPMSLAEAIDRLFAEGTLAGEPATVRVFVGPGHVTATDQVVADLESLAGVEVVEVRDQEASFDEFVELFGDDRSEVVERLEPDDLPVTIEARVDDDSSLQGVHDRFAGDPRIFRVLDDRFASPSAGASIVAAAYADALDALAAAHPGSAALVDAIVASSPGEPAASEAALAALRDDARQLLDAAARDCGLEVPD